MCRWRGFINPGRFLKYNRLGGKCIPQKRVFRVYWRARMGGGVQGNCTLTRAQRGQVCGMQVWHTLRDFDSAFRTF